MFKLNNISFKAYFFKTKIDHLSFDMTKTFISHYFSLKGYFDLSLSLE